MLFRSVSQSRYDVSKITPFTPPNGGESVENQLKLKKRGKRFKNNINDDFVDEHSSYCLPLIKPKTLLKFQEITATPYQSNKILESFGKFFGYLKKILKIGSNIIIPVEMLINGSDSEMSSKSNKKIISKNRKNKNGVNENRIVRLIFPE